MSDPVYTRAPGVLWRFAGDRVLTRRRVPGAADVEADLLGATAVVWLALNRPRAAPEIASELAAAGSAAPEIETSAALAELCERGLVNS